MCLVGFFQLALLIVGALATAPTCLSGATCSSENNFTLKVATLNLMMDEFSPLREERIPAQIDYLNNGSDFDILCLQELWNSSIRSRILGSLSSKYPNKVVFPFVQSDPCPAGIPACNEAELRIIGSCLAGPPCNNPSLSSLEKISCVTRNCLGSNISDRLSPRCNECFSFSSSGFSINTRLRNCAGLLDTPPESDSFTSCQTIYNGSLDTVILSKYPLVNQRFDRYRLSPVWIQGSLHAQVQLPNSTKSVDIFCTHPVTDFPLVDFEQTNLDQARNLVEIVQSQTGSSENLAVVLGDFNAGPEINQRDTANPALDKDVKSLFPRSYDEFLNAGWLDTLSAAGTRSCTWCPDQNPLANGGPFWLDHIFIAKNSSSSCLISSNIVANQSIVQVPSQPNPVPLSDHFGVQATFCP
eukprot:TRINITY_DN16043_c0_g1_i1.p1 TRINITY_DN16043_c0_g1~~TRINITY_DN16043_c0_g1_i1.p1  ORF type:complete len:413 (+),score=49.11 TRINITY_DN16043_c0_g1_i1:143-1381(+)